MNRVFSFVSLCSVAVAAFVFNCANSFAQADPVAINIVPSNLAWESVPAKIIAEISTPMGYAIGISLSILVILWALGMFKKGAKA